MIMNKTILGSMGIGILSLVYLWEASQFPIGSAAAPDIGYVPWLVGWIALGLSMVLAFITWRSKPSGSETDMAAAGDSVDPGPWIISAGLLVYPLLLDNLGFFLGTMPLTYISLLVMGVKRYWAALAIAALMTGISYYLFAQWLGVQFPTGWLGW